MKKITCMIFLLCTVFVLSAQESAKTLVVDLKSHETKKVLVVAHRGDWRNAPENSLQAFQNCIAMGVDMIEIDLKMTKDNQLVIMHDNTIDRTTDGKGKFRIIRWQNCESFICKMDWEELLFIQFRLWRRYWN